MRVLHLPTNIASQISVTVRALRDVGVDARGILWGNAPTANAAGIATFGSCSRRRHPLRGLLLTLAWYRTLRNAMRWADVIHWHFGLCTLPFQADIRYAAKLEKPRIVEFWGSDVRDPPIASADNPYQRRFYEQCPPSVLDAITRSARKAQERFSRLGFACLISGPELKAYVDSRRFTGSYFVRQRMFLSEFEPQYADPNAPRPLVVHAPSHKGKKGTDCVLRVIEQLRRTHVFEFQLLHGVERSEALRIVRRCDVFLDQFVVGDHGLATLEAMAFGKPAVCYIKPSLVPEYPPDCPIVNANQDNLAQVVEGLLVDGQRRHEIGRRSRAYVEQHHDAHQIARQLIKIYEELIEKNRDRRHRGDR